MDAMEEHFDEYEHWNFSHEKYMFCGRSGKQRTKKERSQNTNRFDPQGHTRKTITKLINSHHNELTTQLRKCSS